LFPITVVPITAVLEPVVPDYSCADNSNIHKYKKPLDFNILIKKSLPVCAFVITIVPKNSFMPIRVD